MMFPDHETENIISALSAAQCMADIFDQKVFLMRDLSLKLSVNENCLDICRAPAGALQIS